MKINLFEQYFHLITITIGLYLTIYSNTSAFGTIIQNTKTGFIETYTPSALNNQVLSTFEGHIITKEGAWCWFADPRALHYENKSGTINSTYIGYIDVHGNIKATQYNFLTGKNSEVLIRSYFQPDDHDNPSFLVLPDERIMIFYSRHTDEACFYYRISKYPGDITALGAEMKIITADNTTYPSPFILSNDPTHIYLCWRGINWHPTIARLTIPDDQDKVSIDWGPYQMVQSTGARPYCKYFSNGKDKIYLTYTTGHPDNEYPNYVYFDYIDISTLQLKDINGNVLSIIANGPHNVNKTTYPSLYPNAVVDYPVDQRDWVWQTALDTDGMPVIALVQISNDKTVHNYYYAKWTGSAWRKTFLANGGAQFHQTPGLELCYSGGMAIDDKNPNIVYCSVPVSGISGNIYEIIRYTIGSDGTVQSSEQITFNSALNNVRPYIITNSANNPFKLIWMHGNYYDWIVSSSHPQGFPTEIHSELPLPADSINLTQDLLITEDFNGQIQGTAHTINGVLVSTQNTYASFKTDSFPNFSISLTPYLYEGSYEGVILKMANLIYGINSSSLKPYLKIGETTFNSTNLLGNSDVWQSQARATGGVWWTPTKLKYFNLSFTYENGKLTIYRNGLIDQVAEIKDLSLDSIFLGGFNGWIEDFKIYKRALNQAEIKKLTQTSIAYTFNNALSSEMELESIKIPDTISTDILLRTKTVSGNSISWTSNYTNIISNSGLVTLPVTNTQVILTATINNVSKTFYVTVLPRNINKNVVLQYNFDVSDVYLENNMRLLKDKSGNGNDAIVYGNAQIDGTLNLTANSASGFSTNGYITAPVGIINNLRSCSFLAKIKPASLTGSPRIFDFGTASYNSIFLRASAFTAGYKYNGGTTTLINSSTSLTVGLEAKVAMTFDAKTKTTKIFLNGTETASSTSIIYEPYQLTDNGTNSRNYIGRTQWWDSSVASSNIDFNGTIDDFMIYNIALSVSEINQIQSGINTGNSFIKPFPISIFPNPLEPNSELIILGNGNDTPEKISIELIHMNGNTLKTYYTNSLPFHLHSIKQTGIYAIRIFSEKKCLFTGKLLVK